nr:MAG TPA: hypothetical protein [Caudoviricetes sp.]
MRAALIQKNNAQTMPLGSLRISVNFQAATERR